MKKDSVKIYLYSRLPHNRIIVTGFKKLEKNNKISLEIIENYNGSNDVPDDRIIEAVVNDNIKIAFDMHDGYCYSDIKIDEYLTRVDYYFKRSFSEEENKKRYSENNQKKIYPLSFDWDVSWFLNPMEWTHGLSDLKVLLKKVTFRNDINYYIKSRKEKPNTILFMCRLWATDGSDEKISENSKKQREQINQMRIEIIRALKEKYGDDFIGGIEDNTTSRKLCPDLILPKNLTIRIAYMRLMRKTSICVASTGLFNSIGWKIAEYVAAGKAIVSEKLNYQLIGDFEKDKNYLEYTNVEECLEAVDKLYNNPDMIGRMKIANKEYFEKYQRPEKQIEYVLNIVKSSKI